MTDFATYLRAVREGHNLTAVELARRSELSKGYIHALEHGKSDPSLTTLIKLAHVFGMPLAAFVAPLDVQAEREDVLPFEEYEA